MAQRVKNDPPRPPGPPVDTLAPRTPPEITLGAGPGPQNPVLVYLASLAPGSHPALKTAACTIARILLSRSEWVRWEEALAIPWHEIQNKHVQAVRQKLAAEYAPASVNLMLSMLRNILRTAWDLGQMSTDAMMRAVRVKNVRQDETRPGRMVSVEEVARLLKACDKLSGVRRQQAKAILAAMWAGGLRRSEIANGVEKDGVDFKTGAILVLGKGRKHRTTYVAPNAVRYLREWDPLRPQKRGGGFFGKLVPQTVAATLEEIRVLAGVEPFTSHDLRRSFASSLLEHGGDISTVKALMGHVHIQTTQAYDRRGEATKQTLVRTHDMPEVPDEDNR